MDNIMLLSLPDDVLLAVLACLPHRELFVCRVACRRLRDLCLHPDLWRHARVRDKGTLHAALRLAPCIGVVVVTRATRTLASLIVPSMACVVRYLHLTIKKKREVPPATAIIRNLAAAGVLKNLSIVLCYVSVGKLTPLLKTVYGFRGLQELNIHCHFLDPLPAAWCSEEAGPSLTKLVYTSESADPFLHLLLRTHAATLQAVGLKKLRDVPVSLLAGIPRLRTLSCAAHDELPQLLTLPLLDSVTLRDSPFDGEVLPSGVRQFLLRASKLRWVSLQFDHQIKSDEAFLALVSSRSAGLIESVELFTAPDNLEILVAGLRQLPSLRTFFTLSTLTGDFLKAVNPVSAPSLSILHLLPPTSTCPHAWIHSPATQDLLVRNPRLHIRLMSSYSLTVLLNHCSCEWCVRGCHKLLKRAYSFEDTVYSSFQNLAFSSHRRTAECPSDCFQVVVSPCSSSNHALT